jgi:hypothetical protein
MTDTVTCPGRRQSQYITRHLNNDTNSIQSLFSLGSRCTAPFADHLHFHLYMNKLGHGQPSSRSSSSNQNRSRRQQQQQSQQQQRTPDNGDSPQDRRLVTAQAHTRAPSLTRCALTSIAVNAVVFMMFVVNYPSWSLFLVTCEPSSPSASPGHHPPHDAGRSHLGGS